MKKSIYLNIILFILVSLLTLSTVVYAWFSLTETNRVQQFTSNAVDYGAIMSFEVKKGEDGEYVTIDTIDDMHSFFGQTVPSDEIIFRIQVENKSSRAVSVNSVIKNMGSLTENTNFYMLDVFYLEDGRIKLNDEYQFYEVDETQAIKHGQILNPYRFSNLVDDDNNFTLIDEYPLELDGLLVIEFKIVYDSNTTHIGYHFGTFIFNSIFVELR
ncbi:MAG: hypothetical protein WC964_04450 [Acholeplasmataceae bacterium]